MKDDRAPAELVIQRRAASLRLKCGKGGQFDTSFLGYRMGFTLAQLEEFVKTAREMGANGGEWVVVQEPGIAVTIEDPEDERG